MTVLSAYLQGVGLLGPGFCDWPGAVPVLAGAEPYLAQWTVLPALDVLPPAERRRTGQVVKLALAVGLEATSNAREDPALLPSVFASSGGDGQACHSLCETLATSDRKISPTRFHTSVHNAASGYWGISTGAMTSSTALCAHDSSFAAGLLEALTQVVVDRTAVLLVAYDSQYPEPLHSKWPIADSLGVAFVLAPAASARSLARLEAAFTELPVSHIPEPQLEALRTSIPAARSLPLLRQLARREQGRVIFDYLDTQRLAIEVVPCA